MIRRILICGIACLAMIICFNSVGTLFAQEKTEKADPVVASIPHQQKIFGIVGQVEYVDLKRKGESVVSIQNKKGEKAQVYLKDLQDGATILMTYRKIKDEKGNEQNVLISMSVIKGVEDKNKK
ncbi:MAG: hypothetical protein ABII88_06155 [Candidatus Omnitrophota bacterium]